MCVCAHIFMCPQRSEEGTKPLEPELKVIVSFMMWVMGTELKSPGGTECSNCWASLQPRWMVTQWLALSTGHHAVWCAVSTLTHVQGLLLLLPAKQSYFYEIAVGSQQCQTLTSVPWQPLSKRFNLGILGMIWHRVKIRTFLKGKILFACILFTHFTRTNMWKWRA